MKELSLVWLSHILQLLIKYSMGLNKIMDKFQQYLTLRQDG